MKPTEHNEMENKALKEHLASAALQMRLTCRFSTINRISP